MYDSCGLYCFTLYVNNILYYNITNKRINRLKKEKKNQVRLDSEDESGSPAQWRWNQCGGGDQCGVHEIARKIER